MTAQLTFLLPEESAEHQMALDGWKWKTVVEEILNNIRQDLKYNPEKLTADKQKILENMRGFIHQCLEDESLAL